MTSNLGITLSSRVRLARNAKNLAFVDKLSNEQQEDIVNMAKNAILNSNNVLNKTIKFYDMSVIDEIEKQNLIEKHLISPKIAEEKRKSAALIDENENISIMINEEDHIRIQCIEKGFNLTKCFENADKIDDLLEEHIEFGFHEQFGYLTRCPTNVGTGMRASVMVHIPMIVSGGLIDKLSTTLSQIGMTIRGIYGEGTKSLGNIYQVSNQITLGVSENETIEKLNQIVKEIVEQEYNAEIMFYNKNKNKIEDNVMRGFGTLKYCYTLSGEEFMSLISRIRLGINLEILKELDFENINKIVKNILPSEISKKYGAKTEEEKNIVRAKIVRQEFKKFNI